MEIPQDLAIVIVWAVTALCITAILARAFGDWIESQKKPEQKPEKKDLGIKGVGVLTASNGVKLSPHEKLCDAMGQRLEEVRKALDEQKKRGAKIKEGDTVRVSYAGPNGPSFEEFHLTAYDPIGCVKPSPKKRTKAKGKKKVKK